MGISYGTWVAQEYARTHPRQTESLILDSIVGPEPQDAYAIDGYTRLPRIFNELCARGRCRSATNDFTGDVAQGRGAVAAGAAARARCTTRAAAGRRSPTRRRASSSSS